MFSTTPGPKRWDRIDRTLLSIQYLRAIAAITVLVVHGWVGMDPWAVSLMGSAMDLFFLMSGFIVVIIASEDTRPLDFARDRIERIVPLYWILTLICFALIYSGILELVFNPVHLLRSLWFGDWAFLAQSLFFYPPDSPFEPRPNPLIPQGWTLNYEIMFYALFAISLWLPRKLMVPALTAAFAILVLIGGVTQPETISFQFWTSPIILEFIVGLWAGLAWRYGWNFLKFFLVVMALWLPVFFIASEYFSHFPFEPVRIVFLPIVLALMLAFIARDRVRPEGLREYRLPRLVGDASYSIYLAHFIPVILIDRVQRDIPVAPSIYFVTVVVGGLAFGLLSYFVIERPIMDHVRRARQRRRLATVGS